MLFVILYVIAAIVFFRFWLYTWPVYFTYYFALETKYGLPPFQHWQMFFTSVALYFLVLLVKSYLGKENPTTLSFLEE